MFNSNEILIEKFVTHTLNEFKDLFQSPDPQQVQSLEQATRTALGMLLRCDCQYHDMQHTMLVTDVGQSILRGRQLARGDVESHSWLQAVVAMLFHDIGYLRSLLPEDTSVSCVVKADGTYVSPPSGASDAFMTPYHVTRGKLFVQERFAEDPLIDTELVAQSIEMTRFPVPSEIAYQVTDTLAALVRAADLIGQMADPQYRQKLSRLYAEFVETGEADRLGVTGPGDLHDTFPEFYYAQVRPYIGSAVDYLKYTPEGMSWISNLYQRLQIKPNSSEPGPEERAPELVLNDR